MLVGTAVGVVAGIAALIFVDVRIRPDVVVGLVIGVPSGIGLLLTLFSGRRWMTTLGAFVLAVAPGWLAVLVAVQAVNSG
jgi:hypothetical protein